MRHFLGGLVLALTGSVVLGGDECPAPIDRGRALLESGDLAGAAEAFEAAASATPADAGVWGPLGTVRNALADYAGGAQACERALALDPSNLRARFDLGVARFNLSRSAEATADFDAVLSVDPKHADATWMRGHCALRAAEWGLAARLFATAAALGPDRYRALGPLYAGVALASDGKKEEASSRLKEAVDAAPTGAVGVMARAYRERLLDTSPCETLLRPEDYLPAPGEHACAARFDLQIGRGLPTWAKVSLSPDFSLRLDRPVAGLSERGFLQAVDLLCLHAQVARSGVDALIVPGASMNAPDLLLVGHPDSTHDASARRALWLLLAAAIGAGDDDEGALGAAVEAQKEAIAAAKAAGVWGDLLAAEDDEAAASFAGAEAVLRRRTDKESDACRLLVTASLNANRKTMEWLDTIGRLSGCDLRARDPGTPRLSWVQALALAARWEEASGAAATCGDSWEAAELSAMCDLKLSRWADAEASFRKALAARPERSAFSRFHIALCQHAQGKSQEARAEWRACAEASPSSYYGMLARGLSTTWAEAAARRKVATDAASAAVDKLSRGWGALARIEALPQHEAASALLEWLEAARKRGGELGSALGAELTETRRTACGGPMVNELLNEALRQARDDVRATEGEDAAAGVVRERLLEVMKRCLSPQK